MNLGFSEVEIHVIFRPSKEVDSKSKGIVLDRHKKTTLNLKIVIDYFFI